MRFFKFFVIALIAFSLLVIATPAKSPPISQPDQRVQICANNSLFAPNLADEFLIRGNHSPGQETELTTNSTLRKPPEIVRLE
jgi:hypothetical protein